MGSLLSLFLKMGVTHALVQRFFINILSVKFRGCDLDLFVACWCKRLCLHIRETAFWLNITQVCLQELFARWSYSLFAQGYLKSKQTKMLSIQLFPVPQFSPTTWNLTDFSARQACLHLADGNIYLGFRWKTRLRLSLSNNLYCNI